MSTLSARERGDMAEDLLPVAANLVTLVHGDGGPRDVHQALARLNPGEKDALLIVLAALVDPDRPMGEALGWVDFDEHGQLTVPRWEDRRPLRDLAPEPVLEDDDTFIDTVAVDNYRDGQPGKVSARERLEAIVQGVARGLTYPDFDRMHNLSRGSTSTFISRTRKAYKERGEEFPELERSDIGTAVLSDEQVVAIREAYAAGGTTDMALSLAYEVSRNTITNLLIGKSYKDAGGPIRAKRKNKPTKATRILWAGGQEDFHRDNSETKDIAA